MILNNLKQLDLTQEDGWQHTSREVEPVDPVLVFVVDGIRLSLQQNAMTREQAIMKITSWYPGAKIIDELMAESPPRGRTTEG